MQVDILKPVVVLIAWTLVMLLWTLATRLPAMRAAGVDMRKLVGTKASDAERLPPNVQWKAHNYNHLHEQPTLFYAVALVLAVAGAADRLTLALAWAYVVFRIGHSLIQATVNRVYYRFLLFGLASLCLIVLTIRAMLAVF